MGLDEQLAHRVEPGSASAPHPEEMRAKVDLRIGARTVVMATARATPAGLISVGVMVAAILLSTAALVHAARKKF